MRGTRLPIHIIGRTQRGHHPCSKHPLYDEPFAAANQPLYGEIVFADPRRAMESKKPSQPNPVSVWQTDRFGALPSFPPCPVRRLAQFGALPSSAPCPVPRIEGRRIRNRGSRRRRPTAKGCRNYPNRHPRRHPGCRRMPSGHPSSDHQHCQTMIGARYRLHPGP